MTELPPLIPPPGALPRITPRDRLNGTPAPGVTLGARAEALRGEHESAAAVKVQAMARGRNARKYQVQESSAAAKLQAVQRGKSARNGVRDYEAWCAREAAYRKARERHGERTCAHEASCVQCGQYEPHLLCPSISNTKKDNVLSRWQCVEWSVAQRSA